MSPLAEAPEGIIMTRRSVSGLNAADFSHVAHAFRQPSTARASYSVCGAPASFQTGSETLREALRVDMKALLCGK